MTAKQSSIARLIRLIRGTWSRRRRKLPRKSRTCPTSVSGLMFVCTHPAIHRAVQVPLMLQTVPGFQADEKDIVVEPSLRFTTPDSVVLAGSVYRPRTADTAPTIVMGTLYGRRELTTVCFAGFFPWRGYAVLVQEVRGTGQSGGDFMLLSNEQCNGAARIALIKKPPCDHLLIKEIYTAATGDEAGFYRTFVDSADHEDLDKQRIHLPGHASTKQGVLFMLISNESLCGTANEKS